MMLQITVYSKGEKNCDRSNLSYKAKIPPVAFLCVLSDRRRDGVLQLAKMEGKKDQERREGRRNKERVVHQGECDAKDARKSFCFAPKGYLHL